MTIQEAIEKAKEAGYIGHQSGWEVSDVEENAVIFLDPLFWQSLGKAMGWDEESYSFLVVHGIASDPLTEWQFQWHCFTQHLIEGKTAESFFEQLN